MDIGKSFTYVFEDPNWIMKVLIGGIVSIIPIVNFAALGFMVTTLKNVADGQPQPLPEWGNFGEHFMKGLYVFLGYLIYFAPAILVYCCAMVLSTGVTGVAGAAGGRDTGGAIAGVLGIVIMCLYCVLGVLVLVAAVLFPAALMRFAMSQNQLSLFWDFRGAFELVSKNIGNYVMAIVIVLVASFVAQLGIILCVIGYFFTAFWAQLVSAHVFGQFWRASQGQAAAS
jgi:hypothetical protein